VGIEAKITSKGQTTIPAEIRERLGLRTGDRIAFVETEEGFLIVPRNRPASSIFGLLAEFGISGTTLADYKDAVADAMADRDKSRLAKSDKDAA
jgi:AbrB family looped-hinge helix DNA binding protein